MSSRIAQKILELMANKVIDFGGDSFKIILMEDGFSFLPGSHHIYSDISTYELDPGNGYTQDNKVLSPASIVRDDTLYKITVTWPNPSWTAAGGSIGPSRGAIIYDDTHGDDPIVQWIDFGTSGTVEDGGAFTVTNPKLEIVTSV